MIKLEPNELDRLLTMDILPGKVGWISRSRWMEPFSAPSCMTRTPALTIELVDADGYVVDLRSTTDQAGAEINATGKIVYGYNLRVGLAGTYRLTYTLPNVRSLMWISAATANNDGVAAAILEIEVIGGGGGGGKGSGQEAAAEDGK